MGALHGRSDFEILAREDFSDTTFSLVVHHPLMARAAKPGQFVIVMTHPEGERIPLTIADFDRAKGTVTLVIQAVGKTTKEMQQSCVVGTHLYGLAGPMGMPSELGHAKKVVCVGGGLGVAPVFPQARGFKQNGAYVIGILGFRTTKLARERAAWQAEQAKAGTASAPAAAAEVAAVPAATAPAPAAVEVEPERSSDDPYIETSRCTTCNECTQINDKMFGYNENKQASIINPDAGTYRQLVEAAESCQVSIIHPGKPRNPNEPGLEELVKRAGPFL